MVNFYRSCRKLSEGVPLSKKEINMVRIYIHFSFSWHLFHGFFAGLVFALLGVVIYSFWHSLLPLSILLYIFSGICIFYFIPIFPFFFRHYYNNCLKKFIICQLQEYKNYILMYTTYMPNSTFDIEKEKVYFLADGYYFYLIEDFLISERYTSFGKKKLFKYPDIKSLNKMNVNFKLSDIVSFQSNDHTEYKVSTLNDMIKKEPISELNCKIALKNFKLFTVGGEIADYFRNIVPEKEIY